MTKKELRFSKKSGVVFILLIFIALTNSEIFAQKSTKDPIRVLFVGNSYTYVGNLPQIVSILAENKKIQLITRKSVKGGKSLKDHWFGNEGLTTKKLISEGKYDYVVLQDQSQAPVEFADTTLKYARLLCDFIKKAGSKPIFYVTWARERIPQQQEVLNSVYIKAANDNSTQFVPVGQAWDLARKLRPTIQLFGPDGSHPANLGVYLTACMFFSSITGESPMNLINDIYTTDKDGELLYLLWVDKEDAIFLQKVVEEVIKTYNK